MIVKYNKPKLSNYFEDDIFGLSPFNEMVRNFYGKDTSSGLINVSETDKSYNLEVVLPGYSKEDIKVEIDKNRLTVSADKKVEKEDKKSNYLRKEFISSSFTRSFELPDDASDENIKAEMVNGILTLTVGKQLEEEKKKSKLISIA